MPPADQVAPFLEHPQCPPARDRVARRASELRSLLTRWANISSGSSDPTGLAKMADAIIEDIHFLPAPVERLLDPASQLPCALRWRSCRSGKPTVLLNGHLDTVFGSEHPFRSCKALDENRLLGPGVTDMKGGLVILFAALQAFLESDLSEQIGWEILITFDEEVGSVMNRMHLEESARQCDLGIVFESTTARHRLVRSRMGTGVIDLIATGKEAHAGRHFQDGRNAIAALSDFVSQAHRFNESIPNSIVNVGKIEGGGPVNVVPSTATARFNVRAWTEEIEKQVVDAFVKLASSVSVKTGCQLTVCGGFNRPSKPVTPETQRLMSAWSQTAGAIGYDLDWEDTGGASDGNILQAAGLPNIDNLGACGGGIHSDSEFVELSSLVERAQLVASFLINLAGGRLDRDLKTGSHK